ncbi:MAG: hypothetical protein Q8909_13300 [Bacteroidota bacterium]|nr:hypothetical protein [Bacteroidota bacterium]
MKTKILIVLMSLAFLSEGFCQYEIKNYLVIKNKISREKIIIPEGKRIKVVMDDKQSFSGPFKMYFEQKTEEFTRIIIKGDTLNITDISKIKYYKYLGYGVGNILSGISVSVIGLFIRSAPEKRASNHGFQTIQISNEAVGDIFIYSGLIPIGIGCLLIWPSTYSHHKWSYTFMQKEVRKRSNEIYPY